MAIEGISNQNRSSQSYGTPDVKRDVRPVEDISTVSNSNSASVKTSAEVEAEETMESLLKGNPPSEQTVKQAISDINKKINTNTIAEYGYHDETNRVTIKLVDKDTDEVIKEYPAEETLDMIAKVWELAGMFVDEKR